MNVLCVVVVLTAASDDTCFQKELYELFMLPEDSSMQHNILPVLLL